MIVRILAGLFIVMIGSLASPLVWAADTGCTPSPTVFASIPDLVIPKDKPIGSFLGSRETGNVTIYSNCVGTFLKGYTKSIAIKGYAYSGQKISGKRIYTTNIPGIGYTLGAIITNVTNHSCNYSSADGYVYAGEHESTEAGGEDLSIVCVTNNTAYSSRVSGGYKIEFYKIGDIQSDTMLAQQVGAGAFRYDGYGGWDLESPVYIPAFNVTVLGCTVETKSLDFPMKDVFLSEFSGVGSVSSSTVTRQLELNCEDSVNVHLKLEGIASKDVANNTVLALTNEGDNDVASGIGVQLLYNDMPLKVNHDMLLNKTAAGQTPFPLTARYYQTKAKMKEGRADAAAILTISYQ